MSPETCVFVAADGVVHARHFEPVTVCGRGVIGTGGKTVQWAPVLQPTIPAVTCVLCLTAMDP